MHKNIQKIGYLLVFTFSAMSINAHAQLYQPTLTPIKIEISTPQISAQTTQLPLKFSVQKGWKTYANLKQKIGIEPELLIQSSTNLKSWSWQWPTPKTLYEGDAAFQGFDSNFEVQLTLIPQNPNAPISINANLALGACETLCLPVQIPLVYPQTTPKYSKF